MKTKKKSKSLLKKRTQRDYKKKQQLILKTTSFIEIFDLGQLLF